MPICFRDIPCNARDRYLQGTERSRIHTFVGRHVLNENFRREKKKIFPSVRASFALRSRFGRNRSMKRTRSNAGYLFLFFFLFSPHTKRHILRKNKLPELVHCAGGEGGEGGTGDATNGRNSPIPKPPTGCCRRKLRYHFC